MHMSPASQPGIYAALDLIVCNCCRWGGQPHDADAGIMPVNHRSSPAALLPDAVPDGGLLVVVRQGGEAAVVSGARLERPRPARWFMSCIRASRMGSSVGAAISRLALGALACKLLCLQAARPDVLGVHPQVPELAKNCQLKVKGECGLHVRS
jgi:hypothetical protein